MDQIQNEWIVKRNRIPFPYIMADGIRSLNGLEATGPDPMRFIFNLG